MTLGMVFNVTRNVYAVNRSFGSMDVFGYTVNCSDVDYETISASEEILINKSSATVSFTLRGLAENISVIANSSVDVSATLIEPTNENIDLYLNDDLINTGVSVDNITSFGENIRLYKTLTWRLSRAENPVPCLTVPYRAWEGWRDMLRGDKKWLSSPISAGILFLSVLPTQIHSWWEGSLNIAWLPGPKMSTYSIIL